MDRLGNILDSIFARKNGSQFDSSPTLDVSFDVLPVSIEHFCKNEEKIISFKDFEIPEITHIGWNPALFDLQMAVLTHLYNAQYREAYDGMLLAFRVIEDLLEQTFLGSPRESKEELLKSIEFWTGIALQLTQTEYRLGVTEFMNIYNQLIRTKAIEIDILAHRHKFVASAPPEARKLYRKIQPCLEERIQTFVAKPNFRPSNADRQTHHLQRRDDMADIYLSLSTPFGSTSKDVRCYSIENTIGVLPSHSVVVDFFRYKPVDLEYLKSTFDAFFGEDRYLALVIHDGEMEYYDLGEAKLLDELIFDHIYNLSGEQLDPFGRCAFEAKPGEEPPSETLWQTTSELLGERLLSPFRDTLTAAKYLFVSPDSVLCRLPFETIAIGAETLLIDRLFVCYLDSVRDLKRPIDTPKQDAGPPCVVGDPDFGIEGAFTPLPGTRGEVETIARMLGVTPLIGESASEVEVKRPRSPKILHVATHGYFVRKDLHDDCHEAGISEFDNWVRLDAIAALENPLVQSGLALAGANTWLATGKLSRQAEDGLLTAEDVLEMDLDGTEIVVLSACETGLGDARSGQGVFGLRRTFAIAGAQSLVISLWSVPDEATRLLMEAFYRYLLEGKGRAESLRCAQLDMRINYPHPLNWAAFVCQGSIGPLSRGS
jgi:CHAT domain-containing protein